MSDEFEQLEEEWARIVRERDTARATAFLADDFVLTSTGGVSAHMPKEAWVAVLPEIDTRALVVSGVQARGFDDVAVVQLTRDASRQGQDLAGDYFVTDVFRRHGGRWRPSWRISVRA